MPITFVTGDPLLTQAQTLLFAHNARGRTELGALETALLHQYPPAFSAYGKACRSERVKAGDYWIWRESAPMLCFCVVRESSVGATRLRYVQGAIHKLARDYRLDSIKSLAIAPIGTRLEWTEIKTVMVGVLKASPLPIFLYEAYVPGQRADETGA